ncbi:MAG: hypothetical protein R2939_01945 [Kofleriaceae bacterium]
MSTKVITSLRQTLRRLFLRRLPPRGSAPWAPARTRGDGTEPAHPMHGYGRTGRRARGTGADGVYVPVPIELDPTEDPTIDRSHAPPAAWLERDDADPWLATDDDESTSSPMDLPAEMVEELDAAQGFQVEEIGLHQPSWEQERGPAYEATYSQPSRDDLRRARGVDTGEAAGESWFEQLSVDAHRPRTR